MSVRGGWDLILQLAGKNVGSSLIWSKNVVTLVYHLWSTWKGLKQRALYVKRDLKKPLLTLSSLFSLEVTLMYRRQLPAHYSWLWKVWVNPLIPGTRLTPNWQFVPKINTFFFPWSSFRASKGFSHLPTNWLLAREDIWRKGEGEELEAGVQPKSG